MAVAASASRCSGSSPGALPCFEAFRVSSNSMSKAASAPRLDSVPLINVQMSQHSLASEADDSDDEELQRAGLPTRRMSPFDIRFSQMRARHEFRDGRALEEAQALIRAVPCEPGDAGGRLWLLQVPFPLITVLQWRCKLRDGQTGRPKVDPQTGGELYDSADHWFTLDNRRLYCLQKVAASLWPDRVLVDALELPAGPLMRVRELRKFRTLDRGRSVMIGGRGENESLFRWSWRLAVGLPEAEEPSVADCHVQMRRRPRADHRSAPQTGHWGSGSAGSSGYHSRRRPAASGKREGEPTEGAVVSVQKQLNAVPWAGLGLFLIVYMLMRLCGRLMAVGFSARFNADRSVGAPGMSDRVDQLSWVWLARTALLGAAAALTARVISMIRQQEA